MLRSIPMSEAVADELPVSLAPEGEDRWASFGRPLTEADVLLAQRAMCDGRPDTQHRLSPLVEATLTDVVHRLRASWLAGPALLWGDVHPIRQLARSQLEKCVTTTFARSFLQFSNLLAGFELLVLELEQHGVVSEQRVLRLEKALKEPRGRFADEDSVPHPDGALGDLPGGADGRGE